VARNIVRAIYLIDLDCSAELHQAKNCSGAQGYTNTLRRFLFPCSRPIDWRMQSQEQVILMSEIGQRGDLSALPVQYSQIGGL
jgi:hypothetical protein